MGWDVRQILRCCRSRFLPGRSLAIVVARRANDAKMGVPTQPGIVEVGPDGAVNEKRPAELNTESIVDVNGEPVRPGRPLRFLAG